jgi:hypothetical protein
MEEELESKGKRWWWCLVLLAAVAATWLSARDFPGGNNVYHIPLVLDYAGSVEGPHDAYHKSFGNFTSYFWTGVAAVVTEQNIRSVFLALLLAGSLLTTLGGYALARAAGARAHTAAIGASFLAFAFAGRDIMEFGGGELFSGFVTHSQFATAAVLFAAALGVRERWIWAAALCGVAADLNLFLGAWAIVNLVLARALVSWLHKRVVPWRGGLAMSAAWLAAASPTIIWALGTVDRRASDGFSFTEYIYETFPYHSFIHLELWTSLAFAGLVVAVCVVIGRIARGGSQASIGIMVAGAALAVALGSIVVYVSDDRMIQSLYPLRYAAVAHWIAAAGVIAAWDWLEREGSERAQYGAVAVLGFALASPAASILGLLLMRPQPQGARRKLGDLAILLALAVALVMPALTDGRVQYPKSSSIGQIPAFIIVCLVGATVIATAPARTSGDRWLTALLLWLVAGVTLVGRPAVALPLAAAATMLAALVAQPSGSSRVAAWILCGIAVPSLAAQSLLGGGLDRTLLAGLMGIAGITLLVPVMRAASFDRLARPFPIFASALVLLIALGLWRGGQLGFDFPRSPRNEHWKQAQLWARANTPPGTYFLAPDRPGFATLSRRPLWWEDNAFAAVMWKPSFYAEWSQRKARVRQVHDLPGLVALAREAGIPYLSLDRRLYTIDGAPGLAIRYCNDDFCILQVAGVPTNSATGGLK